MKKMVGLCCSSFFFVWFSLLAPCHNGWNKKYVPKTCLPAMLYQASPPTSPYPHYEYIWPEYGPCGGGTPLPAAVPAWAIVIIPGIIMAA